MSIGILSIPYELQQEIIRHVSIYLYPPVEFFSIYIQREILTCHMRTVYLDHTPHGPTVSMSCLKTILYNLYSTALQARCAFTERRRPGLAPSLPDLSVNQQRLTIRANSSGWPYWCLFQCAAWLPPRVSRITRQTAR